MLEFFVPGHPVAQGSMRAMPIKGGGAALLQGSSKAHREALADWRQSIRAKAAELVGDGYPLEGPVWVSGVFGFVRPASHPKTRPTWPIGKTASRDIDKLLRAVLDALTGVVWVDDGQVTGVQVYKEWRDKPGVSIQIVPAPAEVKSYAV